MTKQLTARKRLEGLAPFLHTIRTSKKPAPSPEKNGKKARDIAKIVKTLERSVAKAFEKMKLDPNSDDDRGQLLVWLAWAVYGGQGPGAPPKWPPKELRRLLDDVNALREADSKLTETRCCELLSKGKAAERRYEGKKSSTLRRVLQKAKALERTAKVLSTPRDLGNADGAGPS
jgi:hypothetical protein